MNDEASVIELVRKILREDARAGIVLAEILGPPPGLQSAASKPWDAV